MDSLPEAKAIRDMQAPDLGPAKRVLKRYLAEWMERHMGFPIGSDERDTWLRCMETALLEAVAEEEMRAKKFMPP